MDQLKIVGVDSKGYGKIYKIVMRDSKLPLISKAIYAYLCSYAGSGTTAFPSRERILHDLVISKNTYTKYLGVLVNAGYITRSRTAGGNLYEIRTSVPDKSGDVVEAKAKGYGTVPKLAMLDQNLTVQAKALYAYLCSYAGSGCIAYPHRKTIVRELDIGLSAYYTHYSALVDGGYITPVQTIGPHGRFGVAEYRLNDALGIDPDTGLFTGYPTDLSQMTIHGEPTAYNASLDGMSQIAIHGENEEQGIISVPISHMPIHGENPKSRAENLFQNVENQQFSTGPQTPLSQKAISRETVYRNLGHAYNNNNLYNKQILSKRVLEQKTSATAWDEKKHCVSLSKSEIKSAIQFERIVREIEGWTSLKKSLQHFPSELDQYAYQGRMMKLLKELVNQLFNIFRRTADVVIVDQQAHSRKLICTILHANLAFEPMNELLFSIIDRLPQIQCLGAYIQKVLLNFAIQKLKDYKNDFSSQE